MMEKLCKLNANVIFKDEKNRVKMCLKKKGKKRTVMKKKKLKVESVQENRVKSSEKYTGPPPKTIYKNDPAFSPAREKHSKRPYEF